MALKANHLRDYQKEIVAQVLEEWHHHRSIMVQMPTGTGKTHVLANIVSAFTGNVLIVAHRVELIAQINETLDKLRVRTSELDKEFIWSESRIRVSSIQTISKRMDTLKFEPELVIIDEAHHALAKTYRILWERWPEAKFLGLTATPCRMNRNGFTELFDSLVTSWGIAEFIRKGVLSVFDYASIQPNSMEQLLIDSLQKRGADGDYQVKEMDELLNRQPSIERLYQSVLQFAEGKKGIVYAISIAHARKIAEYYNHKGIKAIAIDSKTPRETRRLLVEAFKAGDIQVLVNVDVFSEGFDCPDVEFIQMARPTLSLSKYLQQVGRGLRKSKGKESCMLIDNVGLCRIFGLPVQTWNWERMFRGELAGKGHRDSLPKKDIMYASCLREDADQQDIGVGLVISHETLLEKLSELEQSPSLEENHTELQAWKDDNTGLWGLKRGWKKITEAQYVTVFGIKGQTAAVRFSDYSCGLVNEWGKVIWNRKGCTSLNINRNRLVEIELEGNEMNYLDLYNLKIYLHKPEIRRYGNFELLKVKHLCFSRTKRFYSSKQDYDSLIITNKGFLLKITEKVGEVYCILQGDNEEYYQIHYWLPDESAIIHDTKGNYYQATKEGKKIKIGNAISSSDWDKCQASIENLEKQIIRRMETDKKKRKQRILDDYRKALPYQSGIKWGLKVGNLITVPPIYRNIKPPVGKYCAVEMNYSQWGIISIDGSILIEPKYTEVSIEENGMAWLTQVTGKKVSVKLK